MPSLVACVDDFFANDGACGTAVAEPTFSHFTALPPPNDYADDCFSEAAGGAHLPRVSVSRVWHPGDRVRWRDRIGDFRRDVGDGEHAEITVSERTYRVRLEELA